MIILRIALNNLMASRRRTLFLGTALFLVTMFFVILLSLTAGISDSLVKAATTLSSGHVNVSGFYKATPTDSNPLVTNVEQLKKDIKEAVPDAVDVVDRFRGWGKLISQSGSAQNGMLGIDYDQEKALWPMLALAPAKDYMENPADPELTKGSFADLKKPHTIIIFASQAKQMKVDVGDALTIRTETLTGQSNTADVTIVAIARDMGLLSGWSSFVDKGTINELYRLKPDVTGVIQIYLKDIDRSTAAMNDLRAFFAKKGYPQLEHDAQPFYMKLLQTVPGEDWTGAKLDVTTWEDESSFLVQMINGIKAVTFALVLLLAVVIVIGITNTMTIAVRERTREIGTLRAVGMTRGRVLALFMLEAVMLGVLASGAGAVVGTIIATVIDAAHVRVDAEAMRVILLSDTIHMVANPSDVITAVVVLTVVSAAAAFFPSLRAARITPVTAMQAAE